MKYVKAFLPHLLIAMLAGMVVITVLDGFNPLMAFLTSNTSKTYIGVMCVVGILVSVMYIHDMRKEK